MIGLAIVASAVLLQAGEKPVSTGPYMGFGHFVGRAGDIDGDSVPDILIGDAGGSAESCYVFVVSGNGGRTLRAIPLPPLGAATPQVDGDLDLDGDGVPDILVAARFIVERDVNRVLVISGRDGSMLHDIQLKGLIWGLGSWARFVPDLDGDGLPEIGVLILRPEAKSGTLEIFSGKTGNSIHTLAVRNVCGASSGAFCPVGDIDADGKYDIAVYADGGMNCRGTISIYATTRQEGLWRLESFGSGSGFGALTTLGDLDADGISELAVSFNNHVVVLGGKSGTPLAEFRPAGKTDSSPGFGWSVAGLGDIDDDGMPDLAIAETDRDMSEGEILAKSVLDGRELWRTRGSQEDDTWRLGYQLVALGDINGDGITDLVAGTWGAKARANGLAQVHSGKDGKLLSQFRRRGDEVVVTRRDSTIPK